MHDKMAKISHYYFFRTWISWMEICQNNELRTFAELFLEQWMKLRAWLFFRSINIIKLKLEEKQKVNWGEQFSFLPIQSDGHIYRRYWSMGWNSKRMQIFARKWSEGKLAEFSTFDPHLWFPPPSLEIVWYCLRLFTWRIQRSARFHSCNCLRRHSRAVLRFGETFQDRRCGSRHQLHISRRFRRSWLLQPWNLHSSPNPKGQMAGSHNFTSRQPRV